MSRMTHKNNLTWALILATMYFLMAGAGCSFTNPQPELSSLEVEAIKAADRAYLTAWLSDDPERVMATLADDAVLMPSGLPVLDGSGAIREFWWPAGSPSTIVAEFTVYQPEVGGDGNFGLVRGSFTLGFEYDGESHLNAGNYVLLVRKHPESSWQISHRFWSDHPPETD